MILRCTLDQSLLISWSWEGVIGKAVGLQTEEPMCLLTLNPVCPYCENARGDVVGNSETKDGRVMFFLCDNRGGTVDVTLW